MDGLSLTLTIVGTTATVIGVAWAIVHERKASPKLIAQVKVTWRLAMEMKNWQGLPVAILGMESKLVLGIENASTTDAVNLEIRQPKPVSGIQYKSLLHERRVILGLGESKHIHFDIIPKIEGKFDIPSPVIYQVGYRSRGKTILPETKPLELVIEKPSVPHLEASRTVTPVKTKVQEVVGLHYKLKNEANGVARQIKITPLMPSGVEMVDQEAPPVTCSGYGMVTITIYLKAKNDGIMELPGHDITYEDDKGSRNLCSVPPLKLEVSFRPAAHLLGRDVELGMLREAREELIAGRGRLVLIPGEAGAGKSRLAEEFLRESQRYSLTVIKGDCAQMHQAIPFHPFKTILTQLQSYTEVSETGTSAAPPEQVQPANSLGGTRSAKSRAPTMSFQESQLEQGNARALVLEVLQKVSKVKPLIVCLEDLHWCDSGSLDILQYIVQHLHEFPLLVIATYRPEEVATSERTPNPFNKALREFRRHHDTVQELPILKPLNSKQVQEFIDSAFPGNSFPPEFADILYQDTEGNPLFLVEVLELLYSPTVGAIVRRDNGWHLIKDIQDVQNRIPATVEAVIQTRLEHLSEEERIELEAAAVLGRQFFFRLWLELSGRSEDELITFAGRYMDYELIREDDPHQEKLIFTHSKIHEVVHQAIRELRRRRMHRRAAELLQSSTSEKQQLPAAELAYHYFEAGDYSAALPYLLTSAHSNVIVNNNYEALRELKRAENALDNLGRETVEDSLLMQFHRELGNVYTNRGEYLLAKDEFQSCLGLAERSGDDKARAWALNSLADINRLTGKYEESERLYLECATLAERVDDSLLLIEVKKDLGQLHYRWGVALRALSQDDKAAASFRSAESYLHDVIARVSNLDTDEIERRELERQAYNYLGIICETEGRYEEAEEYYFHCKEITERFHLQQYVHNSLGELRRQQGRLEEAIEHYRAFLQYAKRAGARREQAMAHNNIGIVHLDKGEYNEAKHSFDQSLDLSLDAGLDEIRIETLIMKGLTLEMEKQPEAMKYYLEALRLRASMGGETEGQIALEGAQAEVYREIGEELLAYGEFSKAGYFLEHCLSISPDDPKAQELLRRCRGFS
jgi:predicted ATPase